jgi:hypothetical protein
MGDNDQRAGIGTASINPRDHDTSNRHRPPDEATSVAVRLDTADRRLHPERHHHDLHDPSLQTAEHAIHANYSHSVLSDLANRRQQCHVKPSQFALGLVTFIASFVVYAIWGLCFVWLRVISREDAIVCDGSKDFAAHLRQLTNGSCPRDDPTTAGILTAANTTDDDSSDPPAFCLSTLGCSEAQIRAITIAGLEAYDSQKQAGMLYGVFVGPLCFTIVSAIALGVTIYRRRKRGKS